MNEWNVIGQFLSWVSLLFFFVITVFILSFFIYLFFFVNQEAAPTITAAFTEPSYLTLPHQQCPPLALVPWSPGRKILRSQTQNWYHCWGLPAANSPYVTHMSWGGFVNEHTRIPLSPTANPLTENWGLTCSSCICTCCSSPRTSWRPNRWHRRRRSVCRRQSTPVKGGEKMGTERLRPADEGDHMRR